MERREDVLRQALDKNADETERWRAYKADNEVAISNLQKFAKQLSVEVMVPIGKKALMPGHLIHTNELLVGHYQGYFSACSAHKAQEICQHRLRLAEQHLKQLEVEEHLWQNKLETPHLEGAMPKANEVEIVEDYDEKAHKTWLQKHRESVKMEKQVERALRETYAADENDVFKKLEEREMIEELGLDPDNLNEQELNKLLEREPEVQPAASEVYENTTASVITEEQVFAMLDKLEAAEEKEEHIMQMDTDAEHNLQSTNELVRNLMDNPTEAKAEKQRIAKTIQNKVPNNSINEHEENEQSSDVPEEVKLIREQSALLPSDQRQDFLVSQLNILKAEMRSIQKKNFISDELTYLMDVVVYLEDDLQELLFEQSLESSSEEDVAEPLPEAVNNKKRRISFAKTDEELIFNKHHTVADMLPKGKKQEKLQTIPRDVIALDESLKHVQTPPKTVKPSKPTSPQILQQVEKNLEFVQQHQSVQDFDLINQILEASTGQIKTLHISFKHSEATAAADVTEFNESTPGSPADFYKLYEKTLASTQSEQPSAIYVNSFEGEQELNVPILKEELRDAAYKDPRTQFSKPSSKLNEHTEILEAATLATKSILRNKSEAELETRAASAQTPNNPTKQSKKNRNKKKKPRTIDDELRDMSAYQKVMHDLVEKETPEPLPEGKFIDAHAPKKRVSRFKEQRAMSRT